MFYVYLLRDKQGRINIGYTQNLKRRLEEHTKGNVYWTSRLQGAYLFYYEAFPAKQLARYRELQLKKYGAAYYGLLKRLSL